MTVSENNGVLTANPVPAVPGATYQWYLNGNPIVAPNPTDPSITITADGEYSVEVTTTDGCTGTASYTSTLDIEDISSNDVYLFPNPAQEVVTIKFGTASSTEITITDQTGRVVFVETFTENEAKLNVESLANGVYNVIVTNENQQNTLRFVKSQK